MRYLSACLLLALCAGCVTHRGKVAVVRGQKFAAQEGSELGKAVADELGEFAADIGADKIDPATVPLTVEAARDNAKWIKQEREVRQKAWAWAKGLAESWGPAAAVLGVLGSVGAFVKRFRDRGRALATVVEGIEGAGDVAGVKARIKSLAVDYGVQPYLDRIVQKVTGA